jgi:uncharacterized protein YodC (DUF2158 family)
MCAIRPSDQWISAMTVIKSGDLVTLKSGGPAMTVDTVNTDIFDDDKITGVLCVWFAGDKLQRVRFDHRAIEPIRVQETSAPETSAPETSVRDTSTKEQTVPPPEAAGDYTVVLDEMVAALNVPADAPAAGKPVAKPVAKRPRPARRSKYDDAAVSSVAASVS